MERLSTYEFLMGIDQELADYAEYLCKRGFTSTTSLVHLTYGDLRGLPEGHSRLILHEIHNRLGPPPGINTTSPSDSSFDVPAKLMPRQLFSTPEHKMVRVKTEEVEDEYPPYQSPMEKRLTDLRKEIEAKTKSMEVVREKVDLVTRSKNLSNTDGSSYCTKCHEKNHRRNRCPNPPCESSSQCLMLHRHQNEVRALDKERGQLKKMLKEIENLESEVERAENALETQRRNFPSAIRSYLINSSPRDYLIQLNDKYVPITKKIQLHTSILQKYYDNKIPPNLDTESLYFQQIIADHTANFKVHQSIESILDDKLEQLKSDKGNAKFALSGPILSNSGRKNTYPSTLHYPSDVAKSSPPSKVTRTSRCIETPPVSYGDFGVNKKTHVENSTPLSSRSHSVSIQADCSTTAAPVQEITSAMQKMSSPGKLVKIPEVLAETDKKPRGNIDVPFGDFGNPNLAAYMPAFWAAATALGAMMMPKVDRPEWPHPTQDKRLRTATQPTIASTPLSSGIYKGNTESLGTHVDLGNEPFQPPNISSCDQNGASPCDVNMEKQINIDTKGPNTDSGPCLLTFDNTEKDRDHRSGDNYRSSHPDGKPVSVHEDFKTSIVAEDMTGHVHIGGQNFVNTGINETISKAGNTSATGHINNEQILDPCEYYKYYLAMSQGRTSWHQPVGRPIGTVPECASPVSPETVATSFQQFNVSSPKPN